MSLWWGTIGVIVTEDRTIRLREEDRDDVNAFLRANDINPDFVPQGSIIDTRGGRIQLTAYAAHPDGRGILVVHGEPMPEDIDLPIKVPYVKEARP